LRRICCFCESWESGGIESFLNNVLMRMDTTGLEIDIVAASIKDSVFTSGLKAKGIRFIELSGRLRNPTNYHLFRTLLQERHYDVIHFNLFQGLSLRYVQIAKSEGVPVRIAHSHNTALRKSFGRRAKLLLHSIGSRLYSPAATEFWACSEPAAKFLFSKPQLDKKGYTFISNGIETERFRFNADVRKQVRAELGLTDAFVIGHVGRLCYQKNQSFLLDVLAELVKQRPESRLLLVGEGEDEAALREKAERLGVVDNVVFYGVTKRVERLFWAMDIFVFPSRFEGLGIVAVEAQAAGLPVVCSEFVPLEAKVSNDICTVPLDVAAWADALLLEVKARAPAAAQAVRKTGFDASSVADRIQSVYEEVK